MAGECIWPVETNFLNACISEVSPEARSRAPYPLIDITNWMAAAGMDPMETYYRYPEELPSHHPLGDVRLSARLFKTALWRLSQVKFVGRYQA